MSSDSRRSRCVCCHFFSFAVALAHNEYSTGRAIAHKPTNYSHFMTTSEPYSAVYSFPWEPYFIADKAYLPRYDARFAGYGNDKAVQTYEMNLRGFKFVVMPDAFVIHIEHEAGPWRCIDFHSWMFAINGYCGFDTPIVLAGFIFKTNNTFAESLLAWTGNNRWKWWWPHFSVIWIEGIFTSLQYFVSDFSPPKCMQLCPIISPSPDFSQIPPPSEFRQDWNSILSSSYLGN